MTRAVVAGSALARALCLARISLAFGRVERATRHEDGVRPETDTDHTVMLGLIACELAPASLDRAKVAAFALAHDLAEVYAGDTQTLVISAEGMAAKREREDAARARLIAELGAGSWVAETLAVYEQQCEPEARWVRAVDKVLPKLTHAFNGCAAAKALTDRPGFVDAHARQYDKLRAEYPEFPDVLALLRASMDYAEGLWLETPAAERTCRGCEFSGWDPDGPYCTQAEVASGFPHGIALHSLKVAERCPAPNHPHWQPRGAR